MWEITKLLLLDACLLYIGIDLERKYGFISKILVKCERHINFLIHKIKSSKVSETFENNFHQNYSIYEMRAASHEAGHAVAAWMSPYVSKINSVNISSEGSGKVLYKAIHAGDGSQWYDLVISLAGLTAELMIHKKFRSGQSREDLQHAKEIAERLAYSGSKPPWQEDLSQPYFDLSKVFYKSSLDERTAKVLNIGCAKARQLLSANAVLFAKTSQAVLTKRTLTDSDIQEIFGQRLWHFR